MLNTDIQTMIAELDAQRIAMGLSYQDVADACNVSKATVYRALTGVTQATAQLLQDIAAAVQYRPAREEILPNNLTQEAYIAYLKELLRRQEEDTDRRIKQLHAHYNRQLRRAQKERYLWAALAIALTLSFVVLFLYDFINLDRGWIQAALAGYSASAGSTGNALLAWFRRLLWNV